VFASKIPTGHPGGHIANEIRQFTCKTPTAYLAGYFVKVIGGFIHNVPTGHIGGYFVNEIRGFVHKIPTGYLVGYIVNEIREFVYNVPTGYWGGYFLKEPTICLVGIFQVNCFKTHNKLTMCPLGKCPFAPSDKSLLEYYLGPLGDFPITINIGHVQDILVSIGHGGSSVSRVGSLGKATELLRDLPQNPCPYNLFFWNQ